jgi:hypothetical protein
MVPGSWLSALLFVLLVAPGLLFELLSERRRASFSESAFREVSRVVLGSLAFSGFAFAVLVILRYVHPAWLPDPRRLLEPRSSYPRDHYRLLLRTLVLQASLALAAVWVWHIFLANKPWHSLFANKQGEAEVRPVSAWRKVVSKARQVFSKATIRRVSAWTQVLRRDCPKGQEAYVRVRLANGVVYSGLVADFTPDLEVDGRELVLAQPMASKTGDNPMTPVPRQYERVVIRGGAVEVMSVEYRLKRQHNAAAEAPRPVPSGVPARAEQEGVSQAAEDATSG